MRNMWLFFVTQYNSSLSSFVQNFRIQSQVVAEKSLTEKKLFSLIRKKNEQIKGLISNVCLFFVTQYDSSLSSFVPNFRILSKVVVAEKSLTEKKVYK